MPVPGRFRPFLGEISVLQILPASIFHWKSLQPNPDPLLRDLDLYQVFLNVRFRHLPQ